MHPACQLCRGACCESLVTGPLSPDSGHWLALHGAHPLPDGGAELPLPCSQRSACGRCRIWPQRPETCRAYAVGGAACRATIQRRRAPQAAEILALLP